MSELTAKQQRFVAEYLIDGNATQAAIRAGYSAKTAHAIGHENLNKPEIAAEIAKRQQKIADKLGLTAESLILDTQEIRDLAKRDGIYASALKANEMLGRSLGEVNPFRETVNINAKVEAPSEDVMEAARRIAFVFAQAGAIPEAEASPPTKH